MREHEYKRETLSLRLRNCQRIVVGFSKHTDIYFQHLLKRNWIYVYKYVCVCFLLHIGDSIGDSILCISRKPIPAISRLIRRLLKMLKCGWKFDTNTNQTWYTTHWCSWIQQFFVLYLKEMEILISAHPHDIWHAYSLLACHFFNFAKKQVLGAANAIGTRLGFAIN